MANPMPITIAPATAQAAATPKIHAKMRKIQESTVRRDFGGGDEVEDGSVRGIGFHRVAWHYKNCPHAGSPIMCCEKFLWEFVHERTTKASAFDNGPPTSVDQNSLLDKYLTDSIHVKC